VEAIEFLSLLPDLEQCWRDVLEGKKFLHDVLLVELFLSISGYVPLAFT